MNCHKNTMHIVKTALVGLILAAWASPAMSEPHSVAEMREAWRLQNMQTQPLAQNSDVDAENAEAGQARSEGPDIYEQLSLFGDVLQQVREGYVDPPENEDLIEAALTGMLTSLDPHSAYLPPKGFDDMQVQTKGEFGGLGIEVTMEKGVVKVVAPIDDTPAQRAGMLPNDLIVKIDGEDVQGMTLSEAVDIMRGEVGTKIVITVVRDGVENPFDVPIIRDVIKIRAVRARLEGDEQNIAYIRITTFNLNTTVNLRKEMSALSAAVKSEDFAGYIIDLRNNPGGLLTEAIKVSDTFLSKGEIVSTRARKASDNSRFNARRGDLSKGAAVMVLINGGSASASEIVAGALQDHHRALIVGTQSFGKGSVQTIMPLSNNGALRLTTARYYTPSGRSIQATGISPDIIIEQQIPEDMKGFTGRREANLRGHLENDAETDTKSNSSAGSDLQNHDLDAPKDAEAAPEMDAKEDLKENIEEDIEENIEEIIEEDIEEDDKPSIAYVPRDLEDDSQLQAAIKLMHDMHQSRKSLTKQADALLP